MGVKHWVRAMLVLAALPSSAFALGLGDIRLNSPLNAPLDAEIDLVNATPEELASLRVQLASRETFARYGLEWPRFLSSVTLTRSKNDAGRDVLRVRSSEAITEPFVTLLVDANWGRGRLVREYTLLLDPPVFAPAAPAPDVQAPATAAARSGVVTRPAVDAAPPPPPSSAPAVAPVAAGGEQGSHAVRRGETLSGIARGLAASQGVSTEQVMVGLYRANPRAFDGTMDVLRAGAVLRIPDAASLSAIDRGTAIAEVRRQRSEWRSRATSAATGAAVADAAAGRLRLVPPSEAGSGTGAGADAAARETQAMRDRLAQLEKELAESRRLLEVRSAQIAELQQRLAGGPGATAPGPSAESTAATPDAPPPAAADADVELPADEVTVPAPDATALPADPAVAATEPAAERAERTARARPAAADATPAEEPSLFGSLLDSVRQFWWLIVGLLALLAGIFGYRRWQQNRAAEIEDTFGGVTTTTAAPEMTMPPPVASDTARLRRPNVVAQDKSGFVVEESGEFEVPRPLAATPAATARTVAADDTLSGETGINLDQGDPLAEADFHMAYGLYDQAADLVRLASAREPERRDLKLKLAEVFFVWGNRDEFLKTARELHGTLTDGAAGEWDKIVIMGKQIAPEDPLFSQAVARSAGSASLDLQLDGGAQPLDFDVFGDGSGSTQTIESVAGSDLDFGPAPRGDVEPTIERPGPAATGPDAPTVLVETGGGTTREMAPQFADAPTAEAPRLDVDLDELLVATGKPDPGDAPTVEQPALRGGEPTIRAKLDAALKQNAPAGDQTAELAIDDLGLDLGDLDKLGDLDSAEPAEPVAGRDDLASSTDAPTMLASFDEEAQQLIEEAAHRGNGRDVAIDPGATAAMETLRVDVAEFGGGHDPGATSMVAALDTTHLDSDDFDLGKLDASGIQPANGHEGLDLDIGQATLPGAGEHTGREEVALPPLEPVTISEVGTKLDLARAYMDMGDPDGARNILREVLAEGSVSQKQEANRLLESLPG
ncbi:MAG: hypothetical protein IT481_07335 [Gammaproteobacteria bacterium]|nr:hypothetical protein [Gammaproteobacteria bacterium]